MECYLIQSSKSISLRLSIIISLTLQIWRLRLRDIISPKANTTIKQKCWYLNAIMSDLEI